MAARTSFVGKPLACAGRVGPRATQVACRSVTRAQVAEVSELQAPRGGLGGVGQGTRDGGSKSSPARPSVRPLRRCLSLSLSLSIYPKVPKRVSTVALTMPMPSLLLPGYRAERDGREDGNEAARPQVRGRELQGSRAQIRRARPSQPGEFAEKEAKER